MYKLLVLDMDGTLLNEHSEITEENVKAVKQAKEQGLHVVIATGRTKKGIDPYLRQLDLMDSENYSVVCSGARILQNDDVELSTDRLTVEDVKLIRAESRPYGLAMHIYSNDGLLAEDDNLFTLYDAYANNMPIIQVDFDNLAPDTPVNKIMLCHEYVGFDKELEKLFPTFDISKESIAKVKLTREHIPHLFENLQERFPKLTEKFNVSRVFNDIIELSNPDANKAEGVAYIADSLGVKREEIISIGDSQNDRHVIEFAGMGIAMGNAQTELKAIADDITESNEYNGVACAIEKHVLANSVCNRI